jgi:uncharacterized membrane protein YoaK (UPF0700 family)
MSAATASAAHRQAGPGRRARHVRDALLVALALSSGAVDATSWLALDHVFSAFMTGNLAFAGFALAHAGAPALGRVLAALAAFALGAGAAARLIGAARATSAWPRRVTAALGVVLLAHLAFLAVWLGVGAHPSPGAATGLLALSSFAMGLQTTAVFALGVRASFTTAATATIAVLMGDLSGWSLSRREHLRLAGVIAGVVAGAAGGALLLRHAAEWAPVVPAALVLAVIAAAELTFGRPRQAVGVDPGT